MKFELMDNEWLPSIEVIREGDELVARFWGFAHEEALRWFDSKAVIESLEIWHDVLGDLEMTVKLHNDKTK